MIKQKGVTLLELLTVVAIIGVLAAFALPAYNKSTQKGHRANCQAALTSLSSAMERHYTQAGSYTGASLGSSGLMGQYVGESGVSVSAPSTTVCKLYFLDDDGDKVTTQVAKHSFTLLGEVSGPLSGSGNLKLNHLGQKFWDKNADGTFAATENCWNC